MPSLSQHLRPLDEARCTAALSAAAAHTARRHREVGCWGPTTHCRPSAISPRNSRCRASRCARRSTDSSRKACSCANRVQAHSVSNRVEKNFSKLTSFSEDMRARGRKPRSVWLNRAPGTVTPEESLTLRSSPGTPVYRFHRIRYADDAPMALEYATVLASCLPSVDAVETSLYEALERTGNRPVRALQRLRAVLFTAEQAKLLKAQEKDAGLLVERVGFLEGRPRDRVLAVLLSRRHLRLRRGAQRVLMSSQTRMFLEAAQAPEVVRAQLAAQRRRACTAIGALLRELSPRAVVTCARGSSDHAATFAKYLIESRTRVLTSSAAPSLSSLYDAKPDLHGVAVSRDLAIGTQSRPARSRGSGQSRRRLRRGTLQRRGLAARRARGPFRTAVRRHRNERRRDQVVHRLAERDRAPGCELDRRSRAAQLR